MAGESCKKGKLQPAHVQRDLAIAEFFEVATSIIKEVWQQYKEQIRVGQLKGG